MGVELKPETLSHLLSDEEGFTRLSISRVASHTRKSLTQIPGITKSPRLMHTNEHTDQIVHLMDDEESLPITMNHVLQAAGFSTRTYSTVEEVLKAQSTVLRGCFILDVHLADGTSGLDLQAELIRRHDYLPILFLTAQGDISMSVRAIKAGAFDFLTKQTTHEVLIATVTAAMAKESKMWVFRQKGQDLKNRWSTLTHCERQVFGCVIAGMANKQISGKLGSTERTIRAHRASVMQKMEVHSIAELVHQAQELGCL